MTSRVRVATRKGLFTVERRADGWSVEGPSFLGDNCSAVLRHPSDGTLHVALDHGHFGVKMHRSRDDGVTWEELACPAYPAPDPAAPPWEDMFGRTIPASLQLTWCIEAGHPSQSGRLWCGTVPGGLFRSDDGGESWTLMDGLWSHPGRRRWMGGGMDFPGIHTILVHPRDPLDVTVAVSCGGLWRSRDDGATWNSIGTGMVAPYTPPELAGDPGIQDVHRVARCRARPEMQWLQHHDGIYRSTDDGASWVRCQDVAPSDFGFAVAAHPSDPDTAWFVPQIKDERRIPVGGRVVVSRTRDGGRSFETLHRGLPATQAWDIVYRHALDVDADGRCLAMGSTTGSLWVSEDGGESWQGLNHHLPPIYALRFDP
ncbi:MAG: exo-alpha-sialidase [Ectothiorhodospiraceae bacterium]|nr:exo-alpha-sialidase [Ectothiorhodospiraceae bacterium]